MIFEPLPRAFFSRPTLTVARDLLGQLLVRRLDDELLVGRIVETEVYGGAEDSTSHAYRGRSGRAAGMFGPVGRAYVYLIYGMYHCLNVVAHAEEGVGAVLIRAVQPWEGVERMRKLRGGVKDHLIGSGPGRLCNALAIDWSFDGADLTSYRASLFLADAQEIPGAAVIAGPRVGVGGRPEDVALPWRFYIADNAHVSGVPRRGRERGQL